MNKNYQVFVRIRPHQEEDLLLSKIESKITLKNVLNKDKEESLSFDFSGIFKSQDSQERIFRSICDHCVTKLIEGHNSCVLAYGQTGSGKTYSIFGEDDYFSPYPSSSILDNMKGESRIERRGLILKTVEYLFKKSKEAEDTREFVITCSFFEIYLDQIRDLGKKFSEGLSNFFLSFLNFLRYGNKKDSC